MAKRLCCSRWMNLREDLLLDSTEENAKSSGSRSQRRTRRTSDEKDGIEGSILCQHRQEGFLIPPCAFFFMTVTPLGLPAVID